MRTIAGAASGPADLAQEGHSHCAIIGLRSYLFCGLLVAPRSTELPRIRLVGSRGSQNVIAISAKTDSRLSV
jgi:hypothetical protein